MDCIASPYLHVSGGGAFEQLLSVSAGRPPPELPETFRRPSRDSAVQRGQAEDSRHFVGGAASPVMNSSATASGYALQWCVVTPFQTTTPTHPPTSRAKPAK